VLAPPTGGNLGERVDVADGSKVWAGGADLLELEPLLVVEVVGWCSNQELTFPALHRWRRPGPAIGSAVVRGLLGLQCDGCRCAWPLGEAREAAAAESIRQRSVDCKDSLGHALLVGDDLHCDVKGRRVLIGTVSHRQRSTRVSGMRVRSPESTPRRFESVGWRATSSAAAKVPCALLVSRRLQWRGAQQTRLPRLRSHGSADDDRSAASDVAAIAGGGERSFLDEVFTLIRGRDRDQSVDSRQH
jgi:hypothetical protein